MQLPKGYNRKKRQWKKTCLECGAEFEGPAIQKYCEEHQDSEARQIRRTKSERWKRAERARNTVNQEIAYNQLISTEAELVCQLEGCGAKFGVTLVPKTTTYPKYCPEHRQAYRRWFFARMQSRMQVQVAA